MCKSLDNLFATKYVEIIERIIIYSSVLLEGWSGWSGRNIVICYFTTKKGRFTTWWLAIKRLFPI